MARSTVNNGQSMRTVRQNINTMFSEVYGASATKETLLSGVTAPVTGDPIIIPRYKLPCVIEASVTGTGAVSATVLIYGQNDDDDPVLLQEITLSGTDYDDLPEPGAIEKFFNSGVWAQTTEVTGTLTVTTGY